MNAETWLSETEQHLKGAHSFPKYSVDPARHMAEMFDRPELRLIINCRENFGDPHPIVEWLIHAKADMEAGRALVQGLLERLGEEVDKRDEAQERFIATDELAKGRQEEINQLRATLIAMADALRQIEYQQVVGDTDAALVRCQQIALVAQRELPGYCLDARRR